MYKVGDYLRVKLDEGHGGAVVIGKVHTAQGEDFLLQLVGRNRPIYARGEFEVIEQLTPQQVKDLSS